MSKAQKLMIEAIEELLKASENDPNPENAKQILKALQFPDAEILKIRLGYLKEAQKEGTPIYDWLRKQCRIMLSDSRYMRLISNKNRDTLLSYYSRLLNGQWCDEKDDLMFSRLRERYQKFISKKTSVYTS
jgi:hypothetical protein